MGTEDSLTLRMRAKGGRQTARDVDEVTNSVQRFGRAADNATRKFALLLGVDKGGRAAALFAFGPAVVPALAAATAGVGALGAAFIPAALGAAAFGAIFGSQVHAVSTAADAIEKAQQKVNATYGPQFVTQHTAAVKQLTVLNRQLVDQFGVGGPAIVSKYAAVKSAVQNFKQSLNPQTFSLIGAGLGLVQRLLPKLRPVVVAVANAFVKLTDSATKGVGGPGFQKFISWLTTSAPRGITAMVKSTVNLAKGFIGLFRAFSPTSKGMRLGLVDLTAKFAKWSAQLGTDSGFQKFLAYLRTSGPKVAHTLGQIAHAIGDLGPTLAIAGGSSLILLNSLAGFVGFLTHIPLLGPALGAALPFLVAGSKVAPGFVALGKAFVFIKALGMAGVVLKLQAALEAITATTILGAVLVLAGAFYLAYTRSKTFRDAVNGLAADLRGPLVDGINFAIDRLKDLIHFVNLTDGSSLINFLTGGAIDYRIPNLQHVSQAPPPIGKNDLKPFKAIDRKPTTLHNILARIPFADPGPVRGHKAGGGLITRSGAYEVGERGSEVVHLPAGASVEPHGGWGDIVVPVTLVAADGRVLAHTVVRAANKAKAAR